LEEAAPRRFEAGKAREALRNGELELGHAVEARAPYGAIRPAIHSPTLSPISTLRSTNVSLAVTPPTCSERELYPVVRDRGGVGDHLTPVEPPEYDSSLTEGGFGCRRVQ
jgi:hypothetical protein